MIPGRTHYFHPMQAHCECKHCSSLEQQSNTFQVRNEHRIRESLDSAQGGVLWSQRNVPFVLTLQFVLTQIAAEEFGPARRIYSLLHCQWTSELHPAVFLCFRFVDPSQPPADAPSNVVWERAQGQLYAPSPSGIKIREVSPTNSQGNFRQSSFQLGNEEFLGIAGC